MASTLMIPGRSYPIGMTSGQRALPNTQQYSTVALSVDFTGWVNPATTRVTVAVSWSLDGGATWVETFSFTEEIPPPYHTKSGGSTSVISETVTVSPFDPTHVRGSVTVQGQAVPLGDITLVAN